MKRLLARALFFQKSYRLFHPINAQFRILLEEAVIEAYNEALASAALESEEPLADPV